jgi:hypothetical protein
MPSASPSPVNPRPTRRLAIASARCAASGHGVTSSTSSSMRTETSTTRRTRRNRTAPCRERIAHEAREVDRAEAAATVGRQGCSLHGFVLSIVSQ